MEPARRAPARFATTSWSLILQAAAGGEPEADALSRVAERYRPPVYEFIRASGFSREEAEDLTQGFFERLLEKKYLQQADRARGRFRSFLLAAVKHFVANEVDRVRAQKRGGMAIHVPVDVELPDGSTPDQRFEKRWALSILEVAIGELRKEMEGEGKLADFERLSPLLTGEQEQSFRELAQTIGGTEGSLRVALHRFRLRFRDQLRRTIADSAADDAVDDEIRFLITALGT